MSVAPSSETARADSIPGLEIEADDVRCTHGATVGPIDEEQVFYLMTRGLPRREAERAIVEGFFAPVLDRIDDESMHERLWGYVRSKLPGASLMPLVGFLTPDVSWVHGFYGSRSVTASPSRTGSCSATRGASTWPPGRPWRVRRRIGDPPRASTPRPPPIA